MEDYMSLAMIAIYTTLLLIPMIYNTLQYNKRVKKTTSKIEYKQLTRELQGLSTNRKNGVKVVILMNNFDEKQLNKFISLLASKTLNKDEKEARD
ncbi:MAG: hypothetical protein J7J82_07110 [Staphylothermus sp.]|nr:hypothetical protein [Staphylothermus sp.]